jgi:acetate CoA/acetoacetate CoA-transferase alpha subunit
MNKVKTIDEVVAKLHDGATIMLGGFLGVGSPLKCIEKIAASGVKDLTIMSEVSGMPGGGFDMAVLFKNHQVKKIITAHIGTCPELLEEMKAGRLEVELYPMGTWSEKIRAAGAGLGGVLTPIGIGTLMEVGKEKLTINGKEYLLELPLAAEFAFIKGYRGDKMGNIEYRGASVNCNKVVATAAEYTVAEVNEIVEIGEIDPNRVGTPGVYVNAVVQGNKFEDHVALYNQHWDEIGQLRKK